MSLRIYIQQLINMKEIWQIRKKFSFKIDETFCKMHAGKWHKFLNPNIILRKKNYTREVFESEYKSANWNYLDLYINILFGYLNLSSAI